MTRWLLAGLVGLTLGGTTPSLAGELITLGAQGPAVTPGDPLNTGPFICSGSWGSGAVTISYVIPQTIQLKGVLFFPGAWNGVVADLAWRLVNVSTGQVIYWTNWDHYLFRGMGPGVPQQVWFPLPAGDYITLHRGEILQLQVTCSDYSGYGFAVQAHVAATLYGVPVP